MTPSFQRVAFRIRYVRNDMAMLVLLSGYNTGACGGQVGKAGGDLFRQSAKQDCRCHRLLTLLTQQDTCH